MVLETWISATAGTLMIASALALAVRHIVLDPKVESWPDAPGWLREVMFWVMVTVGLRGVDILMTLNTQNGSVPFLGLTSTAAFALYQVSMAANVLRQHYRKDVWRRLKRIDRLARCSDGGVLALLDILGFKVAPKKGKLVGLVEGD